MEKYKKLKEELIEIFNNEELNSSIVESYNKNKFVRNCTQEFEEPIEFLENAAADDLIISELYIDAVKKAKMYFQSMTKEQSERNNLNIDQEDKIWNDTKRTRLHDGFISDIKVLNKQLIRYQKAT